MTNDVTDKKQIRFTLRMNEQIFLKIKQNANKNKRSVNKEIEFVLESQLKK